MTAPKPPERVTLYFAPRTGDIGMARYPFGAGSTTRESHVYIHEAAVEKRERALLKLADVVNRCPGIMLDDRFVDVHEALAAALAATKEEKSE
jgi:hypothetical protein